MENSIGLEVNEIVKDRQKTCLKIIWERASLIWNQYFILTNYTYQTTHPLIVYSLPETHVLDKLIGKI